jgi:hypothetical protein
MGPFKWVPYFCEENVWHLCQEAVLASRPRQVVFISNEDRRCAVWHQRAATRPGWPILWDYHVVLLCAAPWEVWDLDSTLGMPVPAGDYLRRSFRDGIPADLVPRFRLVDAGAFVQGFASDRAHMRTARGGWKKRPPSWPAILPSGVPPNLMRLVDLTDPILGEVVDLRELAARVAGAELSP